MARSKKNFVPDEPISASASAEIGALFANELITSPTVPQDINIARIRPNPFQARHTFTGVEELAAAVRAHGFTTRLRVRRDPNDRGMFQLVFGERRLRAAQLVGLESVPCDVAEHSDDDLIEIGLAENIQRRDLDPLEEAEAFQRFIDQRGYSIRRLAERLGKDKGYIENRLALLRVPEDVQQLVSSRPDTMRAARIIAQLPSAELRQPLIDGLIAGDLTQQDIAANVRSLQQMPTAAPETPNDTVSDASDDETSTVADEGSAVIAHTAQHHEVRHASPTIVGAPSAFSRTLDRDMIQLVSTLSRWRMGAPKSGADEQMRMLQFIQEKLRPQLEVLTQELMERQM
jgi:ParB family chromosome partitioning protein